MLLADTAEKLDSMNLLRLMAPVALTLLLPAIALLEPGAPAAAARLATEDSTFAALLAGNAALAYVVNFTNFQITKYTSALTLQARHRAPSHSRSPQQHTKPACTRRIQAYMPCKPSAQHFPACGLCPSWPVLVGFRLFFQCCRLPWLSSACRQ